MAKQQGGGGAGGGRAGGSKGMQRMPLRPEDLGLPPGMSLDGAEAEITWELDEEDLAEMEFQEGEEGEWEFDPETGTMAFSRGGVINEDGTVTWTSPSEVAAAEEAAAAAAAGMGLLDSWHRTAVFREKTKKALGAVRRLAREGRITKLEKAKLIHSVITSTSHDEISQVEMAYDLLVKRGVGDLEEFAGACVCRVGLWVAHVYVSAEFWSLALSLTPHNHHQPPHPQTNARPSRRTTPGATRERARSHPSFRFIGLP